MKDERVMRIFSKNKYILYKFIDFIADVAL